MKGLSIVEAFVCVVGFLIPQNFPILFAFPSHLLRICIFYHSSHSRSSEMDLSRHKSHPVFPSLLIFFRFYLFVYSRFLLEVDLYMGKVYLWEELVLKDILYQIVGSDGRDFVKDFTRA